MKNDPASAGLVDPAIAMRGGVDVAVALFSGEQKTVLVRLLPLDESMRTFLSLIESAHALADWVTGNEAGWSKTVQPASVLELAEKAIDLNFALACRWAELQAKFVRLAGELKSTPSGSPRPPVLVSSAPTPAS